MLVPKSAMRFPARLGSPHIAKSPSLKTTFEQHQYLKLKPSMTPHSPGKSVAVAAETMHFNAGWADREGLWVKDTWMNGSIILFPKAIWGERIHKRYQKYGRRELGLFLPAMPKGKS